MEEYEYPLIEAEDDDWDEENWFDKSRETWSAPCG
jgi:hypothetical protein